MPKDIYKITNFQSGINSSGDPRDIEDTYSVEMSGLTASSAGRLKVHGGLDYYSVTKEYTTVDGASGSQSVLIPTASIQTDNTNMFIEHDETNDLGGGGLFYFVEDYDLATLDPADWATVDSSFKDKGVEYFLIHNKGYLRLINIVHNDDGTQTANSIGWNQDANKLIYDGIKGIYYHRSVVSSDITVDGIDYTNGLVGLYTGALDGRWDDGGTDRLGDVNRELGAVRFFQQGGLIRYINAKPTTLSRYGQGHSHYFGAMRHDGVLLSIDPHPTNGNWNDVSLNGYQCDDESTMTAGYWPESVPEGQIYTGIFQDWGKGGFIKRNAFFTGEAAPILRPRVYSYNDAQASTTFHVNIGATNNRPIDSNNNHGTPTAPPGGMSVEDNNYWLLPNLFEAGLESYPTRTKSTLSVWQGNLVDYDVDAPELIGEWEFGTSAVYHDGQETNIVLGTRMVDTSDAGDASEGYFEKVRIKTDDWNNGGAANPTGPMRFVIHLLGWPFLDSERISKYRYYIRDIGTESWHNFAEVDLTTGMLNTFACEALGDSYESSQKLIPYTDANDIVTYRSSIWEITGLPEFTYEDYNGHNSSGSWVSTDINYEDDDIDTIAPSDDEYNGIGLQEENVKFWGHWKTAALYKNRVFYGNVTTPDGVEREDTMIASPEGQYDKMPFDGFHWENVATGDGDKIVHLDSYGGHLLQFKRKNVYALQYDENQALVVDKTFTGLGIAHPCQVCHTPNGLVWITAQGCFLFRDGNIENLINNKIATGNQYIPFPNDANTEFNIDNTSQWYDSVSGSAADDWWYVNEVTETIEGEDVTSYPDLNWDINAVDYVHHGWQGFFLPSLDIGIEASRPFVGYDAVEDILIIGRSANYQTDFLSKAKGSTSNEIAFNSKNDAYMYNFKTASWSFSKHLFTNYKNQDKEIVNGKLLTGYSSFQDGNVFSTTPTRGRIAHTKTNPVLTRDGKFAMGMNQLSSNHDDNLCEENFLNIMAWDPSSHKSSPWSRGMGRLVTKDIDFGFPGVRKKIYKVYITYRYPNHNELWEAGGDTTGASEKPKVSYFVNGERTFAHGDIVIGDKPGYFGQNFYHGALSMEGVENADASGYLTGYTENDWKTAELKPSEMPLADNIYSFQLMISADNPGGTFPGGEMKGFPPGFEIADIAIVYRRKPIK